MNLSTPFIASMLLALIGITAPAMDFFYWHPTTISNPILALTWICLSVSIVIAIYGFTRHYRRSAWLLLPIIPAIVWPAMMVLVLE